VTQHWRKDKEGNYWVKTIDGERPATLNEIEQIKEQLRRPANDPRQEKKI